MPGGAAVARGVLLSRGFQGEEARAAPGGASDGARDRRQTGIGLPLPDVALGRDRDGENVGVFGRVGCADGNVEPYEFTDIDRTASLGMSFGGKLWGRPDDTIGIAGVANVASSTCSSNGVA